MNNQLCILYNTHDRYIKNITELHYFFNAIPYTIANRLIDNFKHFIELIESKQVFNIQNISEDDKNFINKIIDDLVTNYNDDINKKYLLDKGIDITLSDEYKQKNELNNLTTPIRKNIKTDTIQLPTKENKALPTKEEDIKEFKHEYRLSHYDFKSEINNAITAFVVSDIIQNNYINYLYFIFNLSEKLTNKIDTTGNIKIIYKGGNVLKNIYETMKTYTRTDDTMSSFFNKSDFDFEIVISNINDENKYNEYYDKCVRLILYIIQSVKTVINDNDDKFLKIKNKINNNKSLIDRLNNYIQSIDKNKNSLNIKTITDISENPNPINRLITFNNTSDNIKTIEINDNNSAYYYNLNEILVYNNNNNISSFILGRIKYILKITYIDDSNKTHTHNFNSEILDLALSRYNDHKYNYYKKININKELLEYKYKNIISYKSHGLNDILYDFIQQFIEVENFWTINKYDKKINRFLYFVNLKLSIDSKTEETYNSVKKVIIDFIKNPNSNIDKIKSLLQDEKNPIYIFLKDIIITSSNKKDFNDKIDKIISIFESLKFVELGDNKITDLKYINKYYKYKNKYNLLKK